MRQEMRGRPITIEHECGESRARRDFMSYSGQTLKKILERAEFDEFDRGPVSKLDGN